MTTPSVPKPRGRGPAAAGLDLLLGPARARFLSKYWPLRPFHHAGPVDRLRRLTALDALHSVAKLATARAANYQEFTVFGGNGFAKYMPPREAMHFYHRGDNLSCGDLESTIPELRQVLAELAGELNGPPAHWSCGMFAAGGGRGVTMHYDPVLTFNVQLHGEKVWRLAPNQHVENPVDASDNHDDHAPRFARGPFPTAMPADAITLRAKPGSVVFIPRGYWHETDTFGASLALTFSLRPPTWRDAILTELRRQLERDAAWREYPMGSAAGPARRDELIARLATLLPQLRAIAGSLQADAVLEVAREP